MSAGQTRSDADLVYLPRDIFWLILGYLEPRDLIRCRRVSHAWSEAFGNPAILVPLMKKLFPWTKETKELEAGNTQQARKIFDQVVSRYDHLGRGEPRSVQKFRLCDDFGITGDREWFEVQPWESHASHMREDVRKQFSEAFWTFEDGLLVYPSADHQCLVLMDLETDRHFMVPFIIRGKVVRRVRLQKRSLVVEWAEPKAFHWLNDSDGVHRHFASSFDVARSANDGWSIIPRNEWKIMFLGHPLSERDRFFSSHSNTHYVIYIWQPNRSLYTADEDAPIESLFVWDISKPSSYRPSLDPTGHLRDHSSDSSPSIVSRFGFRDLEFFSVRQRGCPRVQCLEITDDAQAVEITENFCHWMPGDPMPTWQQTITTSIPLRGYGPHWRRSNDLILPPYRGNCTMQPMSLSFFGMIVGSWFGMIAEVIDEDADVTKENFVYFCLHFDPLNPIQYQMITLSIMTPVSEVTRENDNFAGRGKICGCERYLLGENCNRELVIYRFDK